MTPHHAWFGGVPWWGMQLSIPTSFHCTLGDYKGISEALCYLGLLGHVAAHSVLLLLNRAQLLSPISLLIIGLLRPISLWFYPWQVYISKEFINFFYVAQFVDIELFIVVSYGLFYFCGKICNVPS